MKSLLFKKVKLVQILYGLRKNMPKWNFLGMAVLILLIGGCLKPPAEETPAPPATSEVPVSLPPEWTGGVSLEVLHASMLPETPSEQCIACHGDSIGRGDVQGVQLPHKTHLQSNLLHFECNDCHKRANLQMRNIELPENGLLKKQVDPEICSRCHAPFPSVMDPSAQGNSCTKICHSNWKERMEASDFVRAVVAMDRIDATPETCLKCHGSRPWYLER
jgi:hypothetical protein